MWRASAYRYFLGACLLVLGRVSLRALRPDEALRRFEEAKAHFVHVGAGQELSDVESRLAECQVVMGDPVAALQLADATLGRARSSSGITRAVPLLERVRGYALLQQGDRAGARRALEASLAAGRTRRDPFEIALTLLALIQLAGVEGVEPAPELVEESHSLIARLKVRVVQAVPLVAS